MAITHYIGIDGGGTKTQGVLTDTAGRVLSKRRLGPSNPNDVGLLASSEIIVSLISHLLADADVLAENVSVFAGISGALALKEKLCDLVKAAHPDLCSLVTDSDMICLLASESPDGNGICLISGTGSVCFLRNDSVLRRIGGWGYLLDTAGSGYDIGRMALSRALKAADGREDPLIHAPLVQALTDYLGAPPEDSIAKIYAEGKPHIASCAPVVFALAESGDPVADSILDENAQALAECITAAVAQSSSDETLPVILGGSICVKGAPLWTHRVEKFLPDDIRNKVCLIVAEAPPVLGALAEAMAEHRKGERALVFPDFKQNFLQTYQNHPDERT